ELFAGSALRPIDGIFHAAQMLDCSWQEIWPRFSLTPARLMGRENGLAVGRPADFCLLRATSDNQLIEVARRRQKSAGLPTARPFSLPMRRAGVKENRGQISCQEQSSICAAWKIPSIGRSAEPAKSSFPGCRTI